MVLLTLSCDFVLGRRKRHDQLITKLLLLGLHVIGCLVNMDFSDDIVQVIVYIE